MMVSDFGPAFDAEAAFQRGFKESGGEIVGSVHFPVATRILRPIYSAPRICIQSRFTFGCPAGHSQRPSARLSPSGACPLRQPRILGQGELTYDEALNSWRRRPWNNNGSFL